ncbi:MAG TPA: hypothetical protein VHF51_14455, partial [Solirubrobacteraceae bacterium]|nr:hypothetical protein [Solirubrobacteraceae bacterium]
MSLGKARNRAGASRAARCEAPASRAARCGALGALLLAALSLAGCGGASDIKASGADEGGGGGTTLSLVAYSTPQVVYDEIIPAFRRTP